METAQPASEERDSSRLNRHRRNIKGKGQQVRPQMVGGDYYETANKIDAKSLGRKRTGKLDPENQKVGKAGCEDWKGGHTC